MNRRSVTFHTKDRDQIDISMKNVRLVIELLSFSVTIFLSVILSYFQYKQYVDNQDLSSITYRKFHSNMKDIYPTFSICLYSSFGMIFKQDTNILGYEGWKGGNIYRKILLGDENVKSDFREIEFDGITVDLLEDVILTFQEVTKGNNQAKDRNLKLGKETRPLELSYQDPNQICVSRKRKSEPKSMMNYESVKMDAKLLYNITADLHIYIHKLNELTKVLHQPIMSFSLNDFKQVAKNPALDNHYHFNINHIEIIRNRPDGDPPCNNSLLDNDSQFRHVVVNEVGCIPPYWKRFFLFSSQLQVQSFPDCAHQEQFRWINQMFLPDFNVENATKLYLKSCNEMNYVIEKTKSSTTEHKKIILQFNYHCEEYKEVINHKAYELQTFLTHIWGIFGFLILWIIILIPKLTKTRCSCTKDTTIEVDEHNNGIIQSKKYTIARYQPS